MALEENIKQILKHRVATNKSLKDIASWQVQHGKDDDARFKKIEDAISELPSVTVITVAVQDAVQKTVNGKIDKIALHLTEQDENLAALSKKIKPFDQTRTWLKEAANIVLYIGGLAIAIGGIIELLRLMKVIN